MYFLTETQIEHKFKYTNVSIIDQNWREEKSGLQDEYYTQTFKGMKDGKYYFVVIEYVHKQLNSDSPHTIVKISPAG